MTDVVINLREIRHNIWRFAPVRNHVMDSRFLRHVLSHQIHHEIQGFDTV
jgi:hypothetical protein